MAEQAGILEPVLDAGRHLTFDLKPGGKPAAALQRLRDTAPASTVIGLGASLVRALDADIPGLRVFPGMAGRGVEVPSTQHALWAFIREPSVSECFDTAKSIRTALEPDLTRMDDLSMFVYRGGRDLSGYEDGTENPKGDKARGAAIISTGPLAGSSFAAVQRWVHDLAGLAARTAAERDNIVGRRISDNQEMEDAPPSAHVKRSAQETFSPPAFMVRRSMPWSEGGLQGLLFLAFGADLDRYERVMRRMVGLDDGIVDGIFDYSRAVSGGYYWCPPQDGGRLRLEAVGI